MNHKLLSTVMAFAAVVALQAATPQRTLGYQLQRTGTAGIGHQATPRMQFSAPAPAKAAAEAPENAIEVPFVHTLGKNEASTNTALYEIVDANNDTKTWKLGGFTAYSVCMKPTATDVEACDDWLLSPPVHLLAGTNYRLSYEQGRTLSSGQSESMEVKMGTAKSVEAMTTEVVPEYTFTNKDFEVFEQDFTVETDGYYYFGIHCTSPKAQSGNLKLCNFGIKVATPKVTPAAAGTLTYELAPQGELKATVTYTAPTTDIEGQPISEITKVEIKTNWIVSHTFTDVTPGQVLTFDTDLYNNGYNRLEATAYINDTPGETTLLANFFAGPDNPQPVTNVKISLSDDYKHVTVSWDPVSEVGESGGWVDTSAVTYYIFDAFGSYYDPALASTAETSVTLDYSEMQGQDFVAYQITAGVGDSYYSLDTSTDIVTVGTPDVLPWKESFANGYYQQMWCVDPASSNSVINGIYYDNELQTNIDDETADPVYLNSQDGDNGFFFFLPYEKDAMYGFFSTKISIKNIEHPILEFYYQGKGSAFDALISSDGGAFEVARTIDLQATPTDDWTLCTIDLTPYKTADYIQVEMRIRAIHNDNETTWSVPLDNIRIRNLVDNDLSFVSLKAPASVKAGESISLEAKIENLGSNASAESSVELYRNGEKVQDMVIGALESGKTALLTFTEPSGLFDTDTISFSAKITWDADQDISGNEATASVAIVMPVYPTAAEVSATADNNSKAVTVAWTAPEFAALTQPETRTEDFESADYTPLTIDDFGGWTLVDGDKGATYTFLKDTLNPYRTTPMAFQLYNPVLAGVPEDYMVDIPTHSGENLLVGWSTNGQNDNWLISPELSGNAQTVTFFARSFSVAYPETFEVLYSTGGKTTDSFVAVDSVANYPASGIVPEDWTEFSFPLPEGAKYFAIRHTAYDTYALYIDDITFEAAGQLPADLTLSGYNVYRDGIKLTAEPVNATEYVDSNAIEGLHSYQVTAVYNYGESRPSEPAYVDMTITSVDDITASKATVVTDRGHVIVTGAEGHHVAILSAAGSTFYSGVPASTLSVSVPTGFYIVTIDHEAVKVVVK